MSENSFSLATVIDDAKKVITNPIGFYKEMPTSGGFSDPLIFAVVLAAVTGLVVTVFSVIGLGGGAAMAGAAGLAALILLPIFAVIASFIGAAILFVIWKLMGSDKDYEVAYRCVAYTFAIMPVLALVGIIPYLSVIVRAAWLFVLFYAASTEVHKLSASTSKIVFGVLAALSLVVGLKGEHTARNFESKWQPAVEESKLPKVFGDVENMEDMTAEEAGQKVGEFLKGLEKAAKEMEEREKKDEDN